MSTESLVDWQLGLSKKAFEKGEHIPASWDVGFDDGADGCMPGGWYLEGIQKNGMPCSFPVKHLYGPFDTEREAMAYIEVVLSAMENIVV